MGLRSSFRWLCLVGSLAAAGRAAGPVGPALGADDECRAASTAVPGEEDGGACGLQALQRRGAVGTAEALAEAAPGPRCAGLEAAENAVCREVVQWAARGGKWDPKAAQWFAQMEEVTGVGFKEGRREDFQRLYYCAPPGGKACGSPPCQCSRPPCGQCYGGSNTTPAAEAPTEAARGPRCASLEAAENAICREVVQWAAKSGKSDPKAAQWFAQMEEVTGVGFREGRRDDFQRLYYCAPPGGKACGSPPCQCSRPPCGQCYKGGGRGGSPAPAPDSLSPCGRNNTSIKCGPPKTPFGYKGREWPAMTFEGEAEMHIFTIGDWGGMDGSLNPVEGRTPIVCYDWGRRPGPSVFPRSRWNENHTALLCSHREFVQCFNSRGEPPCAAGCGYVAGVDDQPQILVANAFKARAAEKDPQYILNVGDNFYWGGIEKTCGTPMDEISYTAHHQFDQIFEGVYHGTGLSGKPWLSVLGNHDWGGRVFNNGWDQQIAYTWASPRWLLPAPYWSVHVDYPDQNFSVDLYMLDSNFMDAEDPSAYPESNICGAKHNPTDADCSIADGPSSVETCPRFFTDLWAEQKTWVQRLLSSSRATWQIIVTHFPCGHEQGFYKGLHKTYGLDLLVTGHRHDQELWLPSMTSKNHMGGLTCIVTGGGGGITSESTPDLENWQYGFFDLTITREEILIQSISYTGNVLANTTVSSVLANVTVSSS